MEDFFKPIFKFMEGNFVILNVIILYGIPMIVGTLGSMISLEVKNYLLKIVGMMIAAVSVIICGFLAFYALEYGIKYTSIFGFVLAVGVIYVPFFDKKQKTKYTHKINEREENIGQKISMGNTAIKSKEHSELETWWQKAVEQGKAINVKTDRKELIKDFFIDNWRLLLTIILCFGLIWKIINYFIK